MRRHAGVVGLAILMVACGETSDEPPPDGSSITTFADAQTSADANTQARDGAPNDAQEHDASASDASTADASTAQGCAKRAYKLCEDFESANAGALPNGWSALAGWSSGSATVTTDEHHWGNRALQSASGSDGQPRAQRSLSALGATAGKHWGRVFYKVKAPPTLPQGGVIHSTFLALRGADESRVLDTVVNAQGKHQFLYNLPDDSCCTQSNYDYTFDGKWHCAEWYIDQSDQSFRFFYEGNELTKLAFKYNTDKKARIDVFKNVALGLINYQKATPANMAWLDDLAIDDTRIGCE